MLNDLKTQQEDLKKELIEMEKSFNLKKEQFIRIQGAIEALTILDGSQEEEES